MNGSSHLDHKVLTVILGGGQGTRLFPLTKTRCKAAVPIGGKYRLIDIPLSNCIHSDLHHIFVLAQYLGQSLHRHVSTTYRFDQFSDGFIEILSAEQTLTDFVWYEGTADAVRKNLSRIENICAEHVLILSADHLYRMDYRELIRHHMEKDADLTVAATCVAEAEASRMGILRVDETMRVRALIEKPKEGAEISGMECAGSVCGPGAGGKKEYLASMGIYLFRKKFLSDVLNGSTAPDFGRHIIPEAIPLGKVSAFRFDGYWEDVGTMRAFFDANLDFASPLPRYNFYHEPTRVYTRPRFLPPAKLADCRVSHGIIGEGSVIERAEITESVIGIRSVIYGHCRLTKCIVMGNEYYEREYDTGFMRPMIGPNVTVDRAIIDRNVVIGEGTEIRGTDELINADGPNYYIRDGIVVIPSSTVIPPGTRIYAGPPDQTVRNRSDKELRHETTRP